MLKIYNILRNNYYVRAIKFLIRHLKRYLIKIILVLFFKENIEYFTNITL